MSATGYAGGDPNKLNVAGGTMTGPLVLSGDPAANLGAATKEYVDAHGGGGSGVSSFNNRTGVVAPASGDYTVSQVTGAAPLASPALTGTPTTPTAAPLTDNTQVASTAYTDAAVAVETARAETAEAGKLAAASNLSDVASAATALGNLAGVPTGRTLTAGTGLTGGGDLTANRSFAVAYGTAAGTAAQGNDSRLALAASSVQSVTAADATITMAGTATAPTVAVTAGTYVTPAGGNATVAPTTALNHRRDTAANWATANPVLAAGELAYETDTGLPKLGDGSTAWTALGYAWQVGQRDPRENYLLGWTAPPEYMNSDNPPTAGELYLQRIVVPAAGSITKVYAFVVSAGSGMTAGENFVGLYDASGNLLATSADASAVWTSTHVAQISVPSTAVTPGKLIYVAALFNGSGMPQLAGGGQQYWDLPNVGPGVPNWASPTPPYNATAPNHWRYMSYSNSLTALPGTVALNSASPDKAFWFGVA